MLIIAFFVVFYIVLCFIGSAVHRLVRGQEKVMVYKYVLPEVEDWEIPEYEPLDIEAKVQETMERGRARAEDLRAEMEAERMRDAERLYPDGPAELRVIEDGVEKVMVKGSDEYDEMYQLIGNIGR